ncbi:MAG: hypothetical protein NTU44_19985, partial [Bacteroidetes bacterium]|nr:hypothetical protein [Bacteroidota bacterium]
MNTRNLSCGKHIVFLLVILVCSSSCLKKKHQRQPRIDPGFSTYLAAFTSGVISSESTIRIRLAQDYSGAVADSIVVDEKLFSFSPSIKGKIHWIDKRTIEYKPDEALKGGKVFNARFYLSKLIDVPAKFKTFEFQFQTIQQDFSVKYEGMTVIDPEKRLFYRLNGVIETADVIDLKAIEKVLAASFNGRQVLVSWNHEANRKLHHYQIDSIPRSEKSYELVMSWNGNS